MLDMRDNGTIITSRIGYPLESRMIGHIKDREFAKGYIYRNKN